MHNGLFELPGVLNMYNAGMPTLKPKGSQVDDQRFPRKSEHLKPLGLNKQDLEDLASFLKSLEEPKRRVFAPPLPEVHEVATGALGNGGRNPQRWNAGLFSAVPAGTKSRSENHELL